MLLSTNIGISNLYQYGWISKSTKRLFLHSRGERDEIDSFTIPQKEDAHILRRWRPIEDLFRRMVRHESQ